MNRRTKGLKTDNLLNGFILAKSAEGLSNNTLYRYKHDLNVFIQYSDGIDFLNIPKSHVVHFLHYLRTEKTYQRPHQQESKLSDKSIRNYWVSLKSFSTWLSLEFDVPNFMDNIPSPKFSYREIEPFTKEEVERLIKAGKTARETVTSNRSRFIAAMPAAKLNEAIILVLLDTGLRTSELSKLTIGNYDEKTGKLFIESGKGDKSRIVYLGRSAQRAIWRYLSTRVDCNQPERPLFLNYNFRPFSSTSLYQLIRRLGEKANIRNAHPHRFRHTFAINYLRNGGNVLALQRLLGHSSLQTVNIYAKLAEIDLKNAQRISSPVDNWYL